MWTMSVEDDLLPLISKKAAEKMDLIKVNYDSIPGTCEQHKLDTHT